MKIGEIILIPFPYAEMTEKKVRPAVIITETEDKYRDLVVSAISSIVPSSLSLREIIPKPSNINNLRVESVIKVDRIVTLKRGDKLAKLGMLSAQKLAEFKNILSEMVR